LIVVKTGKNWLKTIGKKAFYSPNLEEGKYYMLKSYSHSRDFTANIYTFEEVEIVD